MSVMERVRTTSFIHPSYSQNLYFISSSVLKAWRKQVTEPYYASFSQNHIENLVSIARATSKLPEGYSELQLKATLSYSLRATAYELQPTSFSLLSYSLVRHKLMRGPVHRHHVSG
jgi:hypothetical protein